MVSFCKIRGCAKRKRDDVGDVFIGFVRNRYSAERKVELDRETSISHVSQAD